MTQQSSTDQSEAQFVSLYTPHDLEIQKQQRKFDYKKLKIVQDYHFVAILHI